MGPRLPTGGGVSAGDGNLALSRKQLKAAADLLRGFPDQAAKAGDKPVEFESDGVALLLDAQRDWGKQIWGALVDRLAQRSAAREPAAKNS